MYHVEYLATKSATVQHFLLDDIVHFYAGAHRQCPTRPASSFTLFHLSLATVLCKVKQH